MAELPKSTIPTDKMRIQPFVLGVGYTNSYVVYFEDGEAYIIDAPDGTGILTHFIETNKLQVRAILLTHGHYDHILGLPELLEAYPEAELYMEKEDACFLLDGGKANRDILASDVNFLKYFEKAFNALPSQYKDYPEEIGPFKVIRMPGHTSGSVSLYSEKEEILFSGDTLFKDGVGRSDLGGNWSELMDSLKKVTKLPENTKVFPGHGEYTTIGQEIKNNPYL